MRSSLLKLGADYLGSGLVFTGLMACALIVAGGASLVEQATMPARVAAVSAAPAITP